MFINVLFGQEKTDILNAISSQKICQTDDKVQSRSHFLGPVSQFREPKSRYLIYQLNSRF